MQLFQFKIKIFGLDFVIVVSKLIFKLRKKIATKYNSQNVYFCLAE